MSVWHYDRLGRNDFLGDVVIALNDQTLNEPEPQWYRLEQEAGMVREQSFSFGKLFSNAWFRRVVLKSVGV